jgi:flagellar biosynthesis protein FlhB
MPEETGEKTEQATPRRREKAKEKGQVPRSRELVSMAGLGGILIMFYFSGNIFFRNITGLTGDLLGMKYGRDPVEAMKHATLEMLLLLLPFFGIAILFSVLTAVFQGGFFVKPLEFEFGRLSPLKGLKNMFSMQGLIGFLKSLLKFIIGGIILYIMIKKALPEIPFTTAMDLEEIRRFATGLISKAVFIAFITFFVIAVLDYFADRWKFERSIRMTKEEVRQEFKETEGDPLIKSRIKSIQREMSRRRMMQQVPKATVVITNPTHIAVALKYRSSEMAAPQVIAKGEGFIAEKIKELAEKHGIPVVEDKPLARALNKLSLDSFIPEELYRAVAKILAYIYKIRGAAA